jgi:DnaJ like chaperone protein
MGFVLGFTAGNFVGRGPVLGFLGGIIGNLVEDYFRKRQKKNKYVKNQSERKTTNPRMRSKAIVEMIYCASAASMLAKMAKSDGAITMEEINAVEHAFAVLGFSARARASAIEAFRAAKDDNGTIYQYAEEFCSVVEDISSREVFYRLLWELAAADGEISPEEVRILQNITSSLKIDNGWFHVYAREFGFARNANNAHPNKKDPYSVLGIDSSASDEDVKKAYRQCAMMNHPDKVRAAGLPQAMVDKATERMAEINNAWDEIKRERKL